MKALGEERNKKSCKIKPTLPRYVTFGVTEKHLL